MPTNEMGSGFWDWWKKKKNDENKQDKNAPQPTAPGPEDDPEPTKPEEPEKVPAGEYPNWGNKDENKDNITIPIEEIPLQKDGEEDDDDENNKKDK